MSAEPARAFLETLRTQGVGYRQAGFLACVDPWLILDVRSGRRAVIRADISARILGIRAALAPGQRVTAWRTWRLLNSLKREGFSGASIAEKLGLRNGHVQFHARHVRVKNACKVRNLWNFIMSEEGGVIEIGERDE